jgi:hypothetical protein
MTLFYTHGAPDRQCPKALHFYSRSIKRRAELFIAWTSFHAKTNIYTGADLNDAKAAKHSHTLQFRDYAGKTYSLMHFLFIIGDLLQAKEFHISFSEPIPPSGKNILATLTAKRADINK